jgi:uncharacterized protein (DUF1330 family)
MTATQLIVLGVAAAALLGGEAAPGLQPQSVPKAYLVTESQILDPAALAAYTPQVQGALRVAGGRPAVISSIGGKIVALEGAAPPNLVVSEWQSLAAAEAWVNSAELKALAPQREKAYRLVRQYIVQVRAQ